MLPMRTAVWLGVVVLGVALGTPCVRAATAIASAPSEPDDVFHQVHLALTDTPGEMVVTVATDTDDAATGVETPVTLRVERVGGVGAVVEEVECARHTYEEGAWSGHLHDCLVHGLRAGQDYVYTLSAGSGGQALHAMQPRQFRMPGGAEADVRVAIVGDTGVDEDAVRVVRMVRDSAPDMVLHLGDFGYSTFPGEWDVGDATYAHIKQTDWDLFFNMIEPVASKAAYMTIPGNHEGRRYDFDFIPYTQRFRMPGPYARSTEPGSDTPAAPEADLYRLPGLWYSFDVGTAHFIGLTTEHEYEPGSEQYTWLASDLEAAEARRDDVPNIIVMLHRPLYSSKLKKDNKRAKLRKALEPLLLQHRVDVVLSGHDHNYERSHPVADGVVLSRSSTDAPAPIHIRVATGGMKPQLTKVQTPPPEWTAARSLEFGYGELTIHRNGSLGFAYHEVSGDTSDRVLISRCRPACSVNGVCVHGGVCACELGWTGPTCSDAETGGGTLLLWFCIAVTVAGVAFAYRSRLPVIRELAAQAVARVRGTSRSGWARVPEIV